MPATPTPWFYLGPAGRLVALPAPEPGIDMSLVKHASRHVSLNAHTTEDVRGFRREWTIAMPLLDADDAGYLEACYTGVVGPSLRLLDPVRRNRLTLAASATDVRPSWRGGLSAVSATSGFVGTGRMSWPEIAYDALDSRTVTYTLDSVFVWSRDASEPGVLALDAGDGVLVTPGETVTASMFVRTTGPAATVELAATARDGTAGTPVVGTTTAGDEWRRVAVTYTAGPNTATVVPQLRTEDPTGTLYVAAAQLEAGAAPTRWVPGSGTPEVLITELPAISPVYPLVSATMSLREV